MRKPHGHSPIMNLFEYKRQMENRSGQFVCVQTLCIAKCEKEKFSFDSYFNLSLFNNQRQ